MTPTDGPARLLEKFETDGIEALDEASTIEALDDASIDALDDGITEEALDEATSEALDKDGTAELLIAELCPDDPGMTPPPPMIVNIGELVLGATEALEGTMEDASEALEGIIDEPTEALEDATEEALVDGATELLDADTDADGPPTTPPAAPDGAELIIIELILDPEDAELIIELMLDPEGAGVHVGTPEDAPELIDMDPDEIEADPEQTGNADPLDCEAPPARFPKLHSELVAACPVM